MYIRLWFLPLAQGWEGGEERGCDGRHTATSEYLKSLRHFKILNVGPGISQTLMTNISLSYVLGLGCEHSSWKSGKEWCFPRANQAQGVSDKKGTSGDRVAVRIVPLFLFTALWLQRTVMFCTFRCSQKRGFLIIPSQRRDKYLRWWAH